MKNRNYVEKCKNINLVLTDVDGVLTDGGRYYSETGEILKKFHVRDGMGVNLLLRNGIKTVIVTKENSKITKRWAKDMNVSKVYSNSIQKENVLQKICKQYDLESSEIAYIGDDVNDTELIKRVGFSATPNDASPDTKKIAHYVCAIKSGKGAFRELVDLILKSKFPKKKNWY